MKENKNWDIGKYNFQPNYFNADAMCDESKIGYKAGNFLIDEYNKNSKKEQEKIKKILRRLGKSLDNKF